MFCIRNEVLNIVSVTTGRLVGSLSDSRITEHETISAFVLDSRDRFAITAHLRSLSLRRWKLDLIPNSREQSSGPSETNSVQISSKLNSSVERAWRSQHMQPVCSLAVDADGHLLASGSTDGSIRLWDLSHLSCLAALHSHSGLVRCAQFVRSFLVYILLNWVHTVSKMLFFTFCSRILRVLAFALATSSSSTLRLVSGDEAGTLRFWSVTPQPATQSARVECVHSVRAHFSSITQLVLGQLATPSPANEGARSADAVATFRQIALTCAFRLARFRIP